MNPPVLSSTFFLTLLLIVGLVFFIRASVKERIQHATFSTELPEETLLDRVQVYFEQRAYAIAEVNQQDNQVTFQGLVRPSWFLAIFLSLLAACGLLCFALILSFLSPPPNPFFFALTLLSPLAGWFYWKRAKRVEQVSVKLEPRLAEESSGTSWVTVTAHRDELAALRQNLPLAPASE